MPCDRVTVTLPGEVVRDIDRLESNRSRFILAAVEREIRRRRRRELHRSLQNPHPQSRELAEAGLTEWKASLPEEDARELVNWKAGKAVRWAPNKGWMERRK